MYSAKMLKAVALAVLIAGPGVAQNPPGLDWRQIQTERFTVVFPAEIATDAQRVANTLEHIYAPVSKTLRGPQKPLDVVLLNQTTETNGFVALAPRRTVWYSTPFQNAGLIAGEWYQMLAIHEMRHVVQFDRMRRGFVRLASVLSGQTGETVLSALLVPRWFWEGDAVGIETALSEAGRGRMPRFELDIRALLLAGRRYSYYKAYHRSYRDWYPSHYQLGYFLTTYVKRRYGPAVWDEVLGRTARWGFHPFAFSRALKKYTGASAAQTYERTMDELAGLWRAQQKDLSTTPVRVLAGQSPSGSWTNYQYPHPLADGSVLASKHGLADPPTLVRLHPDGREERVRFYQSFGGIRSAGGKLVWNRSTPDPRWAYRNYSDVVVLDIASGQTRQLTHKAKLFAPALSPDGERVAAVEFGPARRCHLVVLETASGAEQARFSAPDGVFWRTPAWSADGRHLAVVRQDDHGNALERIAVADGNGEIVLPHTHADIGWPVFWGSYLLFDAPHAGIDNIHAVHLPSAARYAVTARPLAAAHAAVAGDSLWFEDYTVDGYRIAVMALDPATWTPVEQVADRPVRYYEPLIDQEQGGPVLADIPQRAYPVSRYRPHLLKVHSWSLSPAAPRYGLSLLSSDLLELSSLSGGVEYNSNERAFSVLGDFSLAAWYPVFSVGGRWGERAEDYAVKTRAAKDGRLAVQERERTDQWTEKSLRVGVELPLDFSRGPYRAAAHLSAQAEWTDIAGRNELNRPADDLYWPDASSPNQAVKDVFTKNHNGRFAPLTYQLTFQRWRPSAVRDLAPAWGQSLQLIYRHTPLAGDYDGALLSGRLELLVPGLAAHHSVRLVGASEWQDPAEAQAAAQPYRFASEQPFVRGYDYEFHGRFYQGAVNYGLPLFYPDWNLGALFYLKRVKANLFYDYGRGDDDAQPPAIYQAAGAELTMNFHLFSLPIPLDMGLRYAYRFDDGDARLEVVAVLAEF